MAHVHPTSIPRSHLVVEAMAINFKSTIARSFGKYTWYRSVHLLVEAFVINYDHEQWGGLQRTDIAAASALAEHLGTDVEALRKAPNISAAAAQAMFPRMYKLYCENGHRRPIDLEHALRNVHQCLPAKPTELVVWLLCRTSIYREEWRNCAQELSAHPTAKELDDALRQTASSIAKRLRVDQVARRTSEVPCQIIFKPRRP